MHKVSNFLCCLFLYTLFVPIITPTIFYRSCHKPRFFDSSSNSINQGHFEERNNLGNYERCYRGKGCHNNNCNHNGKRCNCNDYEGFKESDDCGNSKECDDLSFVNCGDEHDVVDIDVNIPPYEDMEIGSIRISRPGRNRPFFCPPTKPTSCDYLN
ncbi:2683_t:CDS:1 [Dentiscutata heterogama]|uniref:2683_t:CDS:1 n=1 Tax=Dentiscutata heterogama TaxID=1316150 RepID=A0ACA9JWY9_9GLOM|nr:2683_t:CDS:1 [Dentiscutata heterogama]